jgi:hypothetical protein
VPDSIPARELGATLDDPAQELASAFYRGLGAEAEAVTPAIRRRDVVIARQLLAAGARAAEAAAYAREASTASARIAPVDLRSFERERLGWLARRRGRDQSQRQVVDEFAVLLTGATFEPAAGDAELRAPVLIQPTRSLDVHARAHDVRRS